MAAAEAEVPVAMRKVYRRLERWRGQRTGRARIPEALWAAAGDLAREHGVNQVSRVLRLEFNHLKRMAESGGRAKHKERALPAFVVLEAVSECTISAVRAAPSGKLMIAGAAPTGAGNWFQRKSGCYDPEADAEIEAGGAEPGRPQKRRERR